MKEINGIKISKLGFNPQKLGDLIYFEGPMLSLYIDQENPDIYYLYKWADNNESFNRWIVWQISNVSLKGFLNKQITLRDLFLNNAICYSIDIDNNLMEQNLMVCSTIELPTAYLPSENSFYNEDRYTEFAQTFKTNIDNNKVSAILNNILSEIDDIKRSLALT